MNVERLRLKIRTPTNDDYLNQTGIAFIRTGHTGAVAVLEYFDYVSNKWCPVSVVNESGFPCG